MEELTQARLKELFTYDAETGKFTRVRRTSARAALGIVETAITPFGYRQVQVDRQRHYEHKLVWLYVYGRWPVGDVDHINCNKLDNRVANLREATRSQNKGNVGIIKSNKSGFKGVCWDRNRSQWLASIRKHGKNYYLGRFSCPRLASQAYAKAAREFFGDFARIE